jgi:hypothetical protein
MDSIVLKETINTAIMAIIGVDAKYINDIEVNLDTIILTTRNNVKYKIEIIEEDHVDDTIDYSIGDDFNTNGYDNDND